MVGTNGLRWRNYVRDRDREIVGQYLENDGLECSAELSFQDLIEDTDTTEAPTLRWYKLHLLTQNGRKVEKIKDLWPPYLIAWGLNIWERDLIKLLQNVCEQNMDLRCLLVPDLPPAFRSFEEDYDKLLPRFPGFSNKKTYYEW
jgi:hypothetical protein